MKSPDRDAADELLQNLAKRKTMEAPFARYCWQNSAQIIEALSELATLRRRVEELEAQTAMPVSGGSMYCGKCNQWLADGRRLLWHPASGKYYCIGCDPAAPLPPGRNEG